MVRVGKDVRVITTEIMLTTANKNRLILKSLPPLSLWLKWDVGVSVRKANTDRQCQIDIWIYRYRDR